MAASSPDTPPVPGGYQLRDDGPVPPRAPAAANGPQGQSLTSSAARSPPVQNYNSYNTAVAAPQPKRTSRLVEHPNGSEGWLPAEDAPLQQMPQPQHHDPHHHQQYGQTASAQVRPISRKSSFSPVKRETSASPTRRDRDMTSPTSTQAGTGGGASIARRATTGAAAGGAGGGSARRGTSLGRSSSRRSTYTTSDGRTLPGSSAFVGGAGATGPSATAEEDEELRSRALEAQAHLTPKQRSRIAKDEAKQGKQLAKIIKKEAKTEKQALGIAINELGELQKFQKSAIKSEARVQAHHTKLLTSFKKAEAATLTAKMKHDMALAELNTEADALEMLRNNARETTEHMQDKAAEVDSLRAMLAVDEREREVKLAELKGGSVRDSEGGEVSRGRTLRK